MKRILLIRHGRTAANDRRLYCGATDLPLSWAGARELVRLRPLTPAPPGCRYVTSGMTRTRQTLRLLFGRVPYEEIPALREMDFGAFEMRGYDELKARPDYQAWITGDNEANIPPGGESGRQMRARALAAFDELRARPGNTVVVTHGGVIAAILAREFPDAGKTRYQWQPPPGHGVLLTFPDSRDKRAGDCQR